MQTKWYKRRLPKWPKAKWELLLEELLSMAIIKLRKLKVPKKKEDKMFLILFTIPWLFFGYWIVNGWVYWIFRG